MGNRLHIHIKHDIQYGTSGFNWKINEVKKLLTSKGCNIQSNLNDDCVGDWEIEQKQFERAVAKIRKMNPDEVASFFIPKRSDVTEGWVPDFNIPDKKAFKDEVVKSLQQFVDTGDHRDGFYHLSWF